MKMEFIVSCTQYRKVLYLMTSQLLYMNIDFCTKYIPEIARMKLIHYKFEFRNQ